MVISMLEIFIKQKLKEKVDFNVLMEIFMTDNGKMTKLMDLGKVGLLMVITMMVNG